MKEVSILLFSSKECGWADLRLVLQSIPEIRVVGEASDFVSLCQLAVARKPDTIVSALRMDGESTLPILLDLRHNELAEVKLLFVAGHFDAYDLAGVAELEPIGFLLWNDLSKETLRHCLVISVLDNIVVASSDVARTFIEVSHHVSKGAQDPPWISERERIVLRRLAEGLTLEQIARIEPMSCRTAERIVAQLKLKFGAPSLFALAVKADHLGLLG